MDYNDYNKIIIKPEIAGFASGLKIFNKPTKSQLSKYLTKIRKINYKKLLVQPYIEEFIKYWETSEDKNISDAFNKGIDKCSTNWVLFINSDDYLANNNVLNNISSDLIKFKNFDMLAFKLKVKNRNLKQTIGIYGGSLINEKKLIMYNTFPHQALITNRKFFLKYGNFSTKFPIAQDYEILLRAKKIKLKKIDKIISIMRDGGITNQNKVKSLKYFKIAQIKNKTNNILIINIIYLYGLFKLFIKSLINKF